MKKLILPILLLLGLTGGAYWWVGFVEVQRSPASVQVDDARLRIWYNLVAPNYADTTAANTNLGLDYIGALIHTKTPAAIYFRDTSAAHHKWTILATTPASPIWGLITGTLSSQTDLQTALNAKQNLIATGTTAQYFRGDLSLATFPTDLSSFSNGPAYLATVNVTNSITGTGASGSPLKLSGDAASPGANKYYGTDNGGTKGWQANLSNGNIYTINGTITEDRHLSGPLSVGAPTKTLYFDSLLQFYINASGVGNGVNIFGLGNTSNFQVGSNQVIASAFGTVSGTGYNSILGDSTIISELTNTDSATIFLRPTKIRFHQTLGAYSWDNLVQANDSTVWKPLVANSAGVMKRMDGWPGGGGGSSTATIQTITSGSSGTVTGSNYWVRFNPASALASYTLTLPASPTVGQSVTVIFGGTITAGTVVTAFTVSPNTSQSIIDNTPPAGSSVTADNTIIYDCIATNLWHRRKL